MVRAALGLAATLLTAQAASAGPLWDALMDKLHGCPPSNYSSFHVLTPNLTYYYECRHGNRVSVYPPDRFPCMPPTYERYAYRCRAVEPKVLVAEREALIARYTTAAPAASAPAAPSGPEVLQVYPKPAVDKGR
jgi:hypothetical protein